MLVNKKSFFICTWSEFKKFYEERDYPAQSPVKIATWGDVIEIVENMFVRTLAPGKLPWISDRLAAVAVHSSEPPGNAVLLESEEK